MYRSRVTYSDGYLPYPTSPYDYAELEVYPSPYFFDYPYARHAPPCIDYPYYSYLPPVLPRPPVIQTNIQSDICYYVDDDRGGGDDDEYDDEHGETYRLSRSKVQVVDLVPPARPKRNHDDLVVSTFQPRDRERVVVPRSTVVRQTSVPTYERSRRMKLMPLYHSAAPQHAVSNRRRARPPVRELIPVATLANTRTNRQATRVRSLTPSF